MSTITIRPFAAIKLLTFALLATAGCHFPGIHGNGHVVTETRTVSDFTSVEADGGFTITWTKGATALQIRTDKNLLNHIETSVEGTKLRLHSHGQLRPTKGIKVTLVELEPERSAVDGRCPPYCGKDFRQGVLP